MKGHLFFNTWCAATMLAELLENVEAEADIVLIDRGLFDALVWLTLQAQRGEVTKEEVHAIESFVLLDRWRSLIDLAVVMNVSAEQAIVREVSQRISRKPGSIMNPDTLAVLSNSVRQTVQQYGSRFAAVIQHDTAGQDVRASNIALAAKILDHFERFVDPDILVVPRTQLDTLPLDREGAFTKSAVEKSLACITNHGRFERRSDAELDNDNIQIVPAGFLTYRDNVFVFQRKEQDPKYRLYGKTTVFQATHVVRRTGEGDLDLLKAALLERITRALFLSRIFPVELIGYCWDRDDP